MSAERGSAGKSHNRLGILLRAGIGDDCQIDPEACTEKPDFLRRQIAAIPKNLRQRGMIRAEETCERPERIARVALAPPQELAVEHLPEFHVATVLTAIKCVNGPKLESGANPSEPSYRVS